MLIKALSLLVVQALSTRAVAIDVAHDGTVSKRGAHADEVADLKRQLQELRDLEAARDGEKIAASTEEDNASADGVPVSVSFAKDAAGMDSGNYLRRQDQDG